MLLVSDAVRVEALHDVLNALRDGHGLLLDDLKVLDLDDGGSGGNEGNLVHVFRSEVFVRDFDETFLPVFFALHVGAEIYGVADFLQASDLDDLEHFVGGDMVDDGAILNGGNGQFFFLFHNCEFKDLIFKDLKFSYLGLSWDLNFAPLISEPCKYSMKLLIDLEISSDWDFNASNCSSGKNP